MKRLLLATALFCLLLTGCANLRAIDSEVQTFSTLRALPAQATFRLDRLPSQETPNKRRDDLERMAEQALGKVGLQRNDAAASYSVQLSIRVQREDRLEWPDAWTHWGAPWHHMFHGPYWSSPWMHTTPWYQREIGLVLRDLLTGQVVYETHAAQEGAWGDHSAILPVLFTAALSDFPAATTGVRKTTIPLPAP